jgi:2-keto-4-pentenoate hydratase/2-oxohepta-3-ene-1,7-dioic acid hydratase in catechol pathway
MRWVTYADKDGPRVGLVVDDRVLGAPDDRPMVDVIAGGMEGMSELADDIRRAPGSVLELAGTKLHAPIPKPPAIRDALCFLDHMRQCLRVLGRDPELAEMWHNIPAFYFCNPSCVVGPFDDVAIAPGSSWFDLELEVGAIVGKPGRDLDPKTAGEHIVGYTFFCDWSARDLQAKDLALGLGQAKGKDAGITLGPWIVTIDELADHIVGDRIDLDIAASVNGTELTRGSTVAMDWTFGEVIAYASRGTDVVPGDVIGSGTHPGGCLLEHLDTDPAAFERWLKPGDVVSLHSDVLGRTEQLITRGADVIPLRTGH